MIEDKWGVHHMSYSCTELIGSLGWFYSQKTGKVWEGSKEQALMIKESFPGTSIWRMNNTGAGYIRPGVLICRVEKFDGGT